MIAITLRNVWLVTTSDFLLRPVLPFSLALKWFCPAVRFMIFPVLVTLYRLAVALCVFSFGIVARIMNYELEAKLCNYVGLRKQKINFLLYSPLVIVNYEAEINELNRWHFRQ